MKILISGGSGMLGSHLIPLLLSKGHEVINLTTNREIAMRKSGNLLNVFWDPANGTMEHEELGQIDAIVNLAGFNLAHKWTIENKKRMYQSRINSTKLLVNFAMKPEYLPAVFVSASGSGYYTDSDALMDENSPKGTGFLSDLTAAWEEALDPLKNNKTRVVILRTAVILNKEHGALARMLPFFKWGLGSAVGSGKQSLSWIHEADAAAAYVFALENSHVQGIYNLATNEPTTNKAFSFQLAAALNKPFFLPRVPALVLKVIFGKMADLVLRSNKMSAEKLLSSGFQFKFPKLTDALNDIFKKQK